jgi:putative addiction module killer protein
MKVQYYVTAEGKEPFTKWLGRLRDKVAHAAILKRIARIRLNLFGDTKPVGDGVFELRVDVGAGYRVYFGQSGEDIVLLLCGGDKDSQDVDILKAKDYWKDYKKANK